MPGELAIRRYRPEDAEPLAHLFHDAVRRGAAAAYTAEQRAAWSPAPPAGALWHERLAGAHTLVAERGGRPAGFMSLGGNGRIDLAYVAPGEMGRGTAGALHDALLEVARARGLARLTAEASRLARPFLARRGWRVISVQEVRRGGVALENFLMELPLGGVEA